MRGRASLSSGVWPASQRTPRSRIPAAVSRLIAAWPSFAFAGVYHLLQSQLRLGRVDRAACSKEPNASLRGRLLRDGEEDASLWRVQGGAFNPKRERGALANRWRVASCLQGRSSRDASTVALDRDTWSRRWRCWLLGIARGEAAS